MNQLKHTEAKGLIEFIDASPSPFHACAQAAARLERAGFVEVAEQASWPSSAGRYFTRRSGSIVAWVWPERAAPTTGLRILGAHTDSPNLRIKPRPDVGAAGYRQLGVEVYGGVLLNSWLNRDLGLSGRVIVRDSRGVLERLIKVDRPLAVLPQLAIHLDREVNERGLVLDRQAHLAPVWGLDDAGGHDFVDFVAAELGVHADAVLSFDLMLHDVRGGELVGRDDEFIASARLDNLDSCYCALRAMLRRLEEKRELARPAVVCLFDHEEIGSTSQRGAASPFLKDALERAVLALGGSRDDYHRAIASSLCLSADMAHAIHPNYRERYEPDHWVRINHGPVIKINTTMRYATDAAGEAAFQLACERVDVPFQKYVHRSNLACGTTIGPLTAANLGIATVDVGNPQLSMHSARELAGARDVEWMIRAMTAFLD